MAQISFEGRITADPEIKYGQDGKPRASFSVAENFRALDKTTNQWEDSGVTFHRVTLFGRHAENPALVKGAIVTVAGTQKSRKYTSSAGEEKQFTETTANSFGVVPVQQSQGQRPSPQGEQWNAPSAPQQPAQQGFAQQGWPAQANPTTTGQPNQGLTDPPW